MRPWLFEGDRIWVGGLDAPLRPGNLVLTRAGDTLLVHRVVQLWGDGRVLTQGDLHSRPDPVWAPADVLGRVVQVERRGARLDLAATWAGRLGLWLARPLRLMVRLRRRLVGAGRAG
jgi:hypothetical protein